MSLLEVIFVSNYIIASISARILSATLLEWHFWISTPISLILSNSSYVVCIMSIHKHIVTTLRLTTRLAAADIRESRALKPSATTANPTPAPPIPNGLEQMDVENED
jgi:hypothetical protein